MSRADGPLGQLLHLAPAQSTSSAGTVHAVTVLLSRFHHLSHFFSTNSS
jgi:hypothetical protein